MTGGTATEVDVCRKAVGIQQEAGWQSASDDCRICWIITSNLQAKSTGTQEKWSLGQRRRGEGGRGGRAFASKTVSRWTTSHPIVRFNSIFPWLCKLYVNTKLRSFRSFVSFSRVNYQSHAYMGKNNAKGFRNIACGNRRKSSSRLAAGWLARSAADVDLWSFEGSREKDRKRIPKSYEIHLLLVLRPQLHTNWNIPVNTTKILPNHSLRLSDDTITWPS